MKDIFKKLVERSMHLLTEMDDYASDYSKCDDRNLKDMYYSLYNLHLEGYQKVRSMIASYLNKLETEHPEEHMTSVWLFLKDIEDEYFDKIKKKI